MHQESGKYILDVYKRQAYSNIKFTDRTIRTVDNFKTNIENLRGLQGIWTKGEDGLTSSGTGDNLSLIHIYVHEKNLVHNSRLLQYSHHHVVNNHHGSLL